MCAHSSMTFYHMRRSPSPPPQARFKSRPSQQWFLSCCLLLPSLTFENHQSALHLYNNFVISRLLRNWNYIIREVLRLAFSLSTMFLSYIQIVQCMNSSIFVLISIAWYRDIHLLYDIWDDFPFWLFQIKLL